MLNSKEAIKMKCPVCGSENVNVQVVTETELKNKHHSVLWWLCIGWWFVPLWWMFFTVPALIIKIFAPKKQNLKQCHNTVSVCQNCGHKW